MKSLVYVVLAASGRAVNYAVYAAALTALARIDLGPAAALIALFGRLRRERAMFLTFLGFRFFALRY